MPPDALTVCPANLPEALTERPQWVAWRFERRGEKWTKLPINPRTGRLASATDPATWGTFAEARSHAAAHDLPGVGFVFGLEDPFTGVDLDGCRDPETGELEPWAAVIVDALDSYTELSPSERGVHVIVRGALPTGDGTRRRSGPIEMYDAGRFFTVTGHRLPGTVGRITPRQDELTALYRRTFSATETAPPTNGRTDSAFTDGEITERASDAKNGHAFRRLYFDGDTADHDHNHSEADAALCAHLAFWTRDEGQIDRLFRRSGLYRAKWERADYRDRTIRRALDLVTDHYAPTGSVSADGHAGGSSPPTPRREPPWPSLDPAALQGLAGDVVAAVDPHTEADPVATLATFLVMFGSAVGRTPHHMVGEDRHGLNEFAALVGETSKARKGSSRSGPLRIMACADPAWARERVQGGLSSGEGLLAAVADPVYRLNKKGEQECVFAGSEDKRLLCVEEELSQLLKVSGREGNIVSEIVRRGWDSPATLRTMTKASPLTVSDPHISIVGHITTAELRRELDDTARANGFGNRFLWLCVRRSKAEPFLEPMPEATVADLGRRVQQAIAHARKTARVTLDDDAREMWRDVYPVLSEGKPGLVGALTARAEAHALRLALTYALLDYSPVIGGDHLVAALAVVDYCEASVRRIFGDATGDPIADRILTALRTNGPMAQNEIVDLFGRHVGSGRLGQALETLVTAGRVRSTKEETSGRHRTVWEAIP